MADRDRYRTSPYYEKYEITGPTYNGYLRHAFRDIRVHLGSEFSDEDLKLASSMLSIGVPKSIVTSTLRYMRRDDNRFTYPPVNPHLR